LQKDIRRTLPNQAAGLRKLSLLTGTNPWRRRAVRNDSVHGRDGSIRDRRKLARLVQTEAGAWGIMKALNDAFINPLLISRGAGPVALGIYNSGANLFGFGSGWFGPRIAARNKSVRKTTLVCLLLGRIIYLGLAVYLVLTGDIRVPVIITFILLWGIGEGLVLPLWSSYIAGMVGPGERGRWLAMRASAATLSTVPVLAAVVLLFLFATREDALPIAYSVAAISGLASLAMVARIFRAAGEGATPPVRSVRSLPDEPGARRFLSGVAVFWFGSAFVWPVLPAYILEELHAPTAYFAITQLLAAIAGVFIQRRWGRLGDEQGAKRVLLLSGVAASIVPALWGLVPVWWLGFTVEVIGYFGWPGHMLGLTLRSVELAKHEHDRSSILGWTNLAQGGGACISPLISAWLVIQIGAVPILFLSAFLRLCGVLIMAAPGRGARTTLQTAEA
jgi:MFS family permease